MKDNYSLLNYLQEGIILLSLSGEILHVNEVAAQLSQDNITDLIGKNINGSKFDKKIISFFELVKSSRTDQKDDLIPELSKDRAYRVYGSIVPKGEQDTETILIVLTDVTPLRRLEKVRRDFVANVSHELRTPIASIQGSVETLLDGAIDRPADAKIFVDMIRRHSERLSSIVEDLLTLSKLEGESRSELNTYPYNVKLLIEESCELSHIRADQKRITMTLEVDSDISLLVNANLLRQALVNLLDNAVKASAEKANINIAAKVAGEMLEIAITDHGTGIKHEHLPRIFERFYTADRSRSSGGSGLGLAIVKHIVLAHGGKVSAQSVEGQGSTFTLKLPL
jgi:two-component system phosphate regulon sensor histidine kinase PhoR